jgi:dihydrofolate reductase
MTVVDSQAPGDTYAPEVAGDFEVGARDPADGRWLTSRTGLRYRFMTWRRRG